MRLSRMMTTSTTNSYEGYLKRFPDGTFSHDLRLVRSFCERVFVLESGHLVEFDAGNPGRQPPDTIRILQEAILPSALVPAGTGSAQ